MKDVYDDLYGRPTPRMKYLLQKKTKDLQRVSNWIEFFLHVDVPLPTPKQLTSWLRQSVLNSSQKRYHNKWDYMAATRKKKKKTDEIDAPDIYEMMHTADSDY